MAGIENEQVTRRIGLDGVDTSEGDTARELDRCAHQFVHP